VPSNRYSQQSYEEVLSENCAPGIRWLDVGCGHQLLPDWRDRQERELVGRASLLVGADLDLSAIRRHRSISCRLLADAAHLPFPDCSFDLVTANMVVEHLDNPAQQFAEVSRVLRPEGSFLFHTPNAQNYFARLARVLPDSVKVLLARLLEGRRSQDVYPTHYRANSGKNIARVSHLAGLEVSRLDFVSSSPVFLVIPPLAAVELFWLRFLEDNRYQHLRTNLIVVLRKRRTVESRRGERTSR